MHAAMILAICLPAQVRWAPVQLEAPAGLSPAVGDISTQGRALGALRAGTFGPDTMALWSNGELVWTLDAFSDAFGGVLESDGTAWGVADVSGTTRVLKVSPEGSLLQTWTLPTHPAFTSIAGAIDGEAVVRASAGSGSSFWTSHVCRADGTVEHIQWETSLYAAAVGRLADGERIVFGSFDEDGWWRGFMRTLDGDDDAPLIDLAELLDIGSEFVHAESVANDGTINLRWRDADFNWRPMRWIPEGMSVIGPPIPFVAAMSVDADTGSVAAGGMVDGVSSIWRWIPGQDAELMALPEEDIAVMNLTIDSRGVVLASVLTLEPTYGQDLRIWLPEEVALGPAASRVVGDLPEGDLLVLEGNGAGDAILNSAQVGVMLLRSIDGADVDGDGVVGVDDLLACIANWGPWEGPCGPDLDFDGDVDVDDVLLLLGAWSAP